MNNSLTMSLETKSNWNIPKKLKNEDLVKYLLEKRELKDTENFLNPSLENIPSYEKLYNAKKAAKKILKFVKAGKKIAIHGDYDSDGICATSLLWSFLYRDLAKYLDIKIDVVPYIPSRIDQGYGLTESSLDDVISLGAGLLISVDCGVRDKVLINQYIEEKKLDFVITDHHQPPEDIASDLNYILVHQMYPGKEYPDREICGTTVAFLLVQALKAEAGIDTEINENTNGLDLVALSTVTDMMPLVGVNRIFVTYGLKQLQKGTRLGFRMLTLRAGIEPKDIDTYHLGYVIGPRINAAGRIGSPLEAVKLLVSTDEKQCQEIANDLNDVNFSRQKMTSDILENAKMNIVETDNLIFVLGNGWHEGIIGLVAGKLGEEFYKPVLVATNNEGVVKGSARSIKGFNITKTLEKYEMYLERFGGHELAAGFTAKLETIEEFRIKITNYANETITKENLTRDVQIDLNLDAEDVSYQLINSMKALEPYGYGNPKPLIYLEDVIVIKKYIMGKEKSHMKLMVKGTGVELLNVVLFNCFEDTEKINENDSIDVIGYPSVNVWNGNETIQFQAKEWRRHNS